MKKTLINTLIIALIIFTNIKCDIALKNNTDITDGKGTSVALYAPNLAYPLNSASEVKLDTTLIWNKVSISNNVEVKYTVYLSTVNPPVGKVSTSQSDTIFKPILDLNTTYYWKVSADDGNGGVKESEVSSFKTIVSSLKLISPRNNANYINLTDKLIWNLISGLSVETFKYNVYFGSVYPPTSKVSSLQTETSYTTSLTANTTYFWKIEAENGYGVMLESEVFSFTTLTSTSSEFVSDGFNFVSVEGGTFRMGCNEFNISDCFENEVPSHFVTLSSFSIGKYEVTQAQWVSVMGSNPSHFNTCNDCPVESISWGNIESFLTKLNSKTGKNYRLPTEAEWEYAARGGKKSQGYKYSGSNDAKSVAWYNNYETNRTTHIIGGKSPNELGIYDMSGNVFERCIDWYSGYTNSRQINPIGASTGYDRVLRGGSWLENVSNLSVTYRFKTIENSWSHHYGFRLVLP